MYPEIAASPAGKMLSGGGPWEKACGTTDRRQSGSQAEKRHMLRVFSNDRCTAPKLASSSAAISHCSDPAARPSEKRRPLPVAVFLAVSLRVRDSSSERSFFLLSLVPFTLTFSYPLTMGAGGGAPQMTSQPVSSIFLCSALPSGAWRTPGLSIP